MKVGFEVANPDRTKYLLALGVDRIKEELALSNKDEDEIETLAGRILASCKMFVESTGVVNCTYRYAKGKEEGRLFGGHLQWTSNRIRGFLCEGMASDIDMNNAHLSLAWNLVQMHFDVDDYKSLKCYVYDRDRVISDIMKELKKSRAFVKEKILAALYMKDKIKTKSKTLSKLDKSLRKLRKDVLNLYQEDYEDYARKYAKSDKKKKENPEGSFLAHTLNIMEAELLMKIRQWISETKDLHVTALVFDGLHVSKKVDGKYVEPKKREVRRLCDMLHKRCMEECNIVIHFSHKPFSSDIEIDPLVWESSMKQIEAEREIATTVVKVSHMYKVLQPDKLWVWKTKEELRGHFTHLDANKVI